MLRTCIRRVDEARVAVGRQRPLDRRDIPLLNDRVQHGREDTACSSNVFESCDRAQRYVTVQGAAWVEKQQGISILHGVYARSIELGWSVRN